MEDTETDPTANPISYIECVVSSLTGGEISEESAQKIGRSMGKIRRKYEAAAAKEGIDFFFVEVPEFDDFAAYLNYLLAANPKSKINVDGFLEKGDLAKAALFLENYLEVATRGKTAERANLRRGIPFVENVRKFHLGEGYKRWTAQLDTDLEGAVKTGEREVRKIFNYLGVSKEVEKAYQALATVRKKEGIGSLLKERIDKKELGMALRTAFQYMKDAFYAYGDMPAKPEIMQMADELRGYAKKVAAQMKGEEDACERFSKKKKGANNKKRQKAKLESERAKKRKKKAVREFGRKLIEFKQKIDSYANNDHYRKKWKELMNSAYTTGLRAMGQELTRVLESDHIQEKAKMFAAALGKVRHYSDRSYDWKDLDFYNINFGYLAVMADREANLKTLRGRINQLHGRPVKADEAEAGEDLGRKAQRIINLMVPEKRRTGYMNAGNVVFIAYLEKRLREAEDVEYQRETAYLTATGTWIDFADVLRFIKTDLKRVESWEGKPYMEANSPGIVVNEAVEFGLKSKYGSNGGLDREMELRLGKRAPENPIRAYHLLFPYAIFFPLDRLDLDDRPSPGEIFRVNPQEVDGKQYKG